jgi:hypothetical protein
MVVDSWLLTVKYFILKLYQNSTNINFSGDNNLLDFAQKKKKKTIC